MASARNYEHILYEVDRDRARVTLNRPKQRNALSLSLLEEFQDALWEADDDQSVHSVIVRGAGPGSQRVMIWRRATWPVPMTV